jgi:tetratricopeptide (TPR) repeat protein
MVRHFTDQADEALDWTESPLTFNTSCFNCHVSQLSTNYVLETDSYRTTWQEPGINCETCHGPGGEHVKVCMEAPEGTVPEDLKIILTSEFTVEQTNDMCAPCHAKMFPLTTTFQPGDRYFDHFGLHTLENIDFYPDGRDLGENYTLTLWRLSPCVKSGELDCIHCHTSSGRYRFGEADSDNACMPCHEEYVKDPAAHSHHATESTGSRCVACHMPKTVFARMQRHDHTMLPPTPAATIAFDSPNACNLCHTDQTADWSDNWVRQWYKRDYQAPLLRRARLIDDARKRDWTQLPQMLSYISSPDRDEIFASSLLRLLEACPDKRKWPAVLNALDDPSPLVRSSAAGALAYNLTDETVQALLKATSDGYRLVRVRAAASLAGYPRERLATEDVARLKVATEEYEASMRCRPDDWSSHYNLGNYYLNQGKLQAALQEFNLASYLQPQHIAPLVNASMVYARIGDRKAAQEKLQQAIEQEPDNAVANFNLGLLLAENGDVKRAERCLRNALKTDPTLAAAAYNLAVLISRDRLEEAVHWCDRAAQIRPDQPKYSYTLAFFLRQKGDHQRASRILEDLIERSPDFASAYTLLAEIYKEQDRLDEARVIYRKALEVQPYPETAR